MKRLDFMVLMIVVVLCPFIAQSAEPPPKAPSDQEIRAKVVGTWIVDSQLPNGISIKGHVTLASDNTFVSKATLRVGGKEKELEYEGKWEAKDGMLMETVTQSTSDGPAVGTVTRDRIIRITEEELVYETERGKTVTRKRKR